MSSSVRQPSGQKRQRTQQPAGADDLDSNYAVESTAGDDDGRDYDQLEDAAAPPRSQPVPTAAAAAAATAAAGKPANPSLVRKRGRKDGLLPGSAPGADVACGTSPDAAATAVWAAFRACSVGRDLTPLELGTPLAAAHFAAPAAAAASSELDATSLVGLIKASLPGGWKAALRIRGAGAGAASRPGGAPSTAGRPQGSLAVLILAQSAVRCVELGKLCAPLGVRVAKLFAKHMSVEEQAALLASGDAVMGIGTPARVARLMELGHLSLAATQLVELDVHW